MVNDAIAEANTINPQRRPPISIIWGYENKEAADAEKKEKLAYQIQEGLIGFHDLSVRVMITKGGYPDEPNVCNLAVTFKSEEMPLVASELYNLFRCCHTNVKLMLFPVFGSDSAVAVCGVETSIAVESLSGRILTFALSKLSISHSLVTDRLYNKKGDDHWMNDGGGD